MKQGQDSCNKNCHLVKGTWETHRRRWSIVVMTSFWQVFWGPSYLAVGHSPDFSFSIWKKLLIQCSSKLWIYLFGGFLVHYYIWYKWWGSCPHWGPLQFLQPISFLSKFGSPKILVMIEHLKAIEIQSCNFFGITKKADYCFWGKGIYSVTYADSTPKVLS